MIRLNNDYCHGAIPEILEALQTTNSEAYAGYELDEWCERAGSLIKEAAACPDAAVHYIVGGTQANVALIAHALRPWESVVCADCGHINVHETGATEHIGHKCETVPARDGKLAASDYSNGCKSLTSPNSGNRIANSKGVHREVESERSWRQTSDLYRVPDSGILQVRLNQRTGIYVYSSGRFFGDFTSSL